MTDKNVGLEAIGNHVEAFEAKLKEPHYGNMDVTSADRTCLSWWFPRIQEAGLPVPETRYIAVNNAQRLGEQLLDGFGSDVLKPLADMLTGMASDEKMGFPCFLRTGHFSGKHDWKRCCYVETPERMIHNLCELSMMQACVMVRLKNLYSVWVVREMLPTKTIVKCTNYGDFPVTREIRVFVDGERIVYSVPYWPEGAIKDGNPENDDWKLSDVQDFTDDEMTVINELASRAGAACGGQWSVDILDTERGFYVTDMAEAFMSYGYDAEKFDGDHQ